MTIHIAAAAQDALCDLFVDLLDAGAGPGTIEIYDGAMPATPETAITDQTLLATLTFSDPAFGDAMDGTASADEIAADTSADATGTATWARLADSDGTALADVDVGATGSGAAIELNTVELTSGGEVNITSFAVSMPGSA